MLMHLKYRPPCPDEHGDLPRERPPRRPRLPCDLLQPLKYPVSEETKQSLLHTGNPQSPRRRLTGGYTIAEHMFGSFIAAGTDKNGAG
jgi:hypothetical protein